MQPERFIQNQICAYLRSRNIFIFIHDSVGIFDPVKKIYRSNKSPYRLKGVSDLLGCLPSGRMLAIEVKTATGRLSPEQKAFIAAVNLAGGYAFMARSVEDVRAALELEGL